MQKLSFPIRVLFTSIFVCSLVLVGQINYGHAKAQRVAFVPEQIVVKLNPLNLVVIDVINARYGTSTIRPLTGDPLVYLLRAPAGANVPTLAGQMALDPRLIVAEPNFLGEIFEGIGARRWAWSTGDPAPAGSQDFGRMLGLAEAHAVSTGTGSVVAVLDTGFQLDHPALAGVWHGIQMDFVDGDNLPVEDWAAFGGNGSGVPVSMLAGHGTHVAHIVHMTAPGAQIMPIRVLDGNGLGNQFTIAEAILFAASHGANVINLSLGTVGKSNLLHEEIGTIVEGGNVVVVAAAGNFANKEKTWPAASSYAIAVGSVNANKQRSDFTSFGSWVDIAAPGENISSAFPINGSASWSGTSMAAPFIAGQAALIHSKFPSLSAAGVEDRILDTAQEIDKELGDGFPNFVASLQ